MEKSKLRHIQFGRGRCVCRVWREKGINFEILLLHVFVHSNRFDKWPMIERNATAAHNGCNYGQFSDGLLNGDQNEY